MSQENFWILFSKKIAGEASAGELAELEQLIRQHPEWQYALQNIEDLWQSSPAQSPANLEAEDAFLLHLQRMKEQNIPFGMPDTGWPEQQAGRKKVKVLRIAAITAAAACLAFLLFLSINNNNKGAKQPAIAEATADVHEVSTRLGSKSRIQLPDGTIVWLNAGSRLTYAKDFGVHDRKVELSGEGFFDVVKDASRPFLIHTHALDIRVLGTVFNVRAYPEDEKSETSLLEGKIEVVIKNRPDDKIILSPNEKLVVENAADKPGIAMKPDKEETLVAINKLKHSLIDSTVSEVQWKDNKLVFDDEKLEDIAIKMERWFAVEIEIRDAELASKRLTGKFENESIEQALEGLAYTSTMSFSFDRKGDKIIIHR